MMPIVSSNTKAILLLTAPLIVGRDSSAPEILTPGEYKRLARHLRELQRTPADFLSPKASEILDACSSVIDVARLQRLLGRGFQLSQAVERWQTRAIWVLSRADEDYPKRLKARLGENAPAVLYGCGNRNLLERGGLAVVGSRHVDNTLIGFTMDVGSLAASAGKTIVSGGARGIDQAAMRGALEAGGKVIGVLADNLERTAMKRESRNLVLNDQLVLITPYDPSAGFNVGNAMQRNKLIYALADVSLVVNTDLKKGGTWAGATEQLDKLKLIPVYVRIEQEPSPGLEALRNKGAIPWPNPPEVDEFKKIFNVSPPPATTSAPAVRSLFPNKQILHYTSTQPNINETSLMTNSAKEPQSLVLPESNIKIGKDKQAEQEELNPADSLFLSVCEIIGRFLTTPMNETEVAVALDVSKAQAKVWLKRMVDEGLVEKRKKPVTYMLKQPGLFTVSPQENIPGNKK